MAAYKDTDDRIVVGIVYVVRELFDELKKLGYENIFNSYYLKDQRGQLE